MVYRDTGIVMDKKHGGTALSHHWHHHAGLTISVERHTLG